MQQTQIQRHTNFQTVDIVTIIFLLTPIVMIKYQYIAVLNKQVFLSFLFMQEMKSVDLIVSQKFIIKPNDFNNCIIPVILFRLLHLCTKYHQITSENETFLI